MTLILRTLLAGGLVLALNGSRALADPQLSSWYTNNAGRYARVIEKTSDLASAKTKTTWPSAGLSDSNGGQSVPVYADISDILYSSSWVYVQTAGLASYNMGPWVTPTGGVFMFWPTNTHRTIRIPRHPTIPTNKSSTPGGDSGVWVNGVSIYSTGDGQSYNTSTGQTSTMGGDGIWNRIASVGESFNFDPDMGHQNPPGQYHHHLNPIALRYQLGDNVTFNSNTGKYSEGAGGTTNHSPILGWANDGLPIYGPYGYATATDSTSVIRRMVSGYVKRDGSNGTVNLSSTGRHTLPAWSARFNNRSATLLSTEYGPTVANTTLGTYAEDWEYLGDLSKTQGVDFDLNEQNARYCVTPDYPGGTYAYFIAIDSSGNTTYPDVLAVQFVGSATGGKLINSITESVTTNFVGGANSTLRLSNPSITGTSVVLTWSAVEGGTYLVEQRSDIHTGSWTTVLSGVTPSGNSGSNTNSNSNANGFYRVSRTTIATYDP